MNALSNAVFVSYPSIANQRTKPQPICRDFVLTLETVLAHINVKGCVWLQSQ